MIGSDFLKSFVGMLAAKEKDFLVIYRIRNGIGLMIKQKSPVGLGHLGSG